MSNTPNSTTTTNRHPLLSRSLSVYSIPPPLLDILTVRSIQAGEPVVAEAEGAEEREPSVVEEHTNTGSSLTCQTCFGTSFASLEEQRTHFKSDWHRYNAKVTLERSGKGAVTAEEFEEINDAVSSLSGSASDTSHEATQPTTGADRITRLIQKQRLTSNATPSSDLVDSDEEAEQTEYRRRAELRTALIWFTVLKEHLQATDSPLVPLDTQLGVHRALLPNGLTDASTFLPALRSVQLPANEPFDHSNPDGERKITLLMVAGGHFAGAVIGLKPLDLVQGKGKKPEKQDTKGAGEIRVICSKTFHRYTTRKKQGGSQALNDNAKSKAVSAGAMLRRYGEKSLQEEIQRLMVEWGDEIRSSERIFLRASTAGKRSFWGYEGAVLEKGDERVKTFPFPTRRPTLTEVFRCYTELTRVKITHLSEDSLKALEEAYIASLQPKTRPIAHTQPTQPIKEKEVKPKLSPDEEAYRERRNRLIDMVRKGRMEPLQALWEKHRDSFGSVDKIVEEWADDGNGMTLLMVASQAGQEDVTRWLLEDLRADPTLPLGAGVKVETEATEPSGEDGTTTPNTKSRGRTAYDLTASKPVRNVFRRLAHDHPEWHDWIGAGHVPSGLSEEKEQEQDKKKADRRKGMREKAKEREAKRAVENPEEAVQEAVLPQAPAKPLTGPQKLGGGRTGGDTGLAGLTPEMRQRIERERRARAAEARLTGK